MIIIDDKSRWKLQWYHIYLTVQKKANFTNQIYSQIRSRLYIQF